MREHEASELPRTSRVSRSSDRRTGELLQALAHTAAHVVSPALEARADGQSRLHDALVVPGRHHGVLLAVAPTNGRRALARAQLRITAPIEPDALGHPSILSPLLEPDAAILRVIVVLRSHHDRVQWIASPHFTIPVVPLRVLVRALRDRGHPDEVWRELADGADGQGSWPPALPESARQAAREVALTPGEQSRAGREPGAPLRALRYLGTRLLLSRLRLPPLAAWTTHEVEPGRLRLFSGRPLRILVVSTMRRGPTIAVMAAADEPSDLAPAATVAEALQHSLDQLSRSPLVRSALRRLFKHRRATGIALYVRPIEQGDVVVSRVATSRTRWIEVGVDSSRDHPDGQALLLTIAGGVINALLKASPRPTGRRARAATRILSSWEALPPALQITAAEAPIWISDRFGAWGPPGRAEEATVDRLLAAAAERRGLPPGTSVGAQARPLLRQLASDLLAQAEELTGTGEPSLLICADQLHRAAASRLSDQQGAAVSMAGPWWENHLTGAVGSAAAGPGATSAAELLVEIGLCRQPGSRCRGLDRPAWRLAAAAAARARALATLATADHRRLATAIVTVRGDGTIAVSEEAGETDAKSYTALRLLTSITDLIGSASPTAPEWGGRPPGTERFQRLADLPAESGLERIDGAMRETIGAGIDAIIGTLVTAADHLPSTGITSRDDLLADAVAFTGEPVDRIEAALDWLTLSTRMLREEPFEYWKLEARRARLATRPLVALGEGSRAAGRLLLVPGRIRMTQLMYLTYLDDGRLPIPRAVLAQPQMTALNDELNRYRQLMNRQLEDAAVAQAQTSGLAYRRNVDPRKTRRAALTISGQIDLLVAVPATRRIWVAEVKDPALAFSPWEMADEVDDFHGGASDTGTERRRRDEVGRLLAKTQEIANQIPAALRLLRTPGDTSGWTVRPIVLTRRLTPAAFVANPRVPFALVHQAGAAFEAPDLAPGPALWLPTGDPDGRSTGRTARSDRTKPGC